jgi:hypothetical protein
LISNKCESKNLWNWFDYFCHLRMTVNFYLFPLLLFFIDNSICLALLLSAMFPYFLGKKDNFFNFNTILKLFINLIRHFLTSAHPYHHKVHYWKLRITLSVFLSDSLNNKCIRYTFLAEFADSRKNTYIIVRSSFSKFI